MHCKQNEATESRALDRCFNGIGYDAEDDEEGTSCARAKGSARQGSTRKGSRKGPRAL